MPTDCYLEIVNRITLTRNGEPAQANPDVIDAGITVDFTS
jgi:hypothetical protein